MDTLTTLLDMLNMPRLVWMVLDDGRSVVAGCGAETREGFERAMAQPDHMLTLTSDDRVDVLPSRNVRDFIVCDTRSTVPAASAIYRLVHV